MADRFDVNISPLGGVSKSRINTLASNSIGSLVARIYPGNVIEGVTKFFGHESGLGYSPRDSQETINGYLELDLYDTLTTVYNVLLNAGEIKEDERNLKIYVIFNPQTSNSIATASQRVRERMRTVHGSKKRRKSTKKSKSGKRSKKMSKKMSKKRSKKNKRK